MMQEISEFLFSRFYDSILPNGLREHVKVSRFVSGFLWLDHMCYVLEGEYEEDKPRRGR